MAVRKTMFVKENSFRKLDDPFNDLAKKYVFYVKNCDIPEGIPHGPSVLSLGNAVQGIGYGANRYRGPHPPPFLRIPHRYVFRSYVLDCRLNLLPASRRRTLMKAMSGHILQEASLLGIFRRT